ncbi:hypothetical protein, partial [Thiolapillus sp.]|uniref:hypothetical protein n=1 Tax=Thiolapillus sp. TaxID=2017437 RepID=UPI003AF469C5
CTGVVQRHGLFRRIGAVDMQLGIGQYLAYERPYLLQIQDRIPVRRVAEVANGCKMPASGKSLARRRVGASDPP